MQSTAERQDPVLVPRSTTGADMAQARPLGPGARVELAIGVTLEGEAISGPRSQEPAPQLLKIAVGDRTVEASRAASCLLDPAPGDQVLVAVQEHRSFVLSVLVRASADGAEKIDIGNGVALEVQGKSLRISGAEAIELAASRSVSASAPELHMRADRAAVVVKTVDVIGRVFESSFDRVRTLAKSVNALADDFTATMKRSIRLVSDLDQTRARTVDTRAEGTITIHGENTLVTARAVAKVDSAQIHIG